MLLACVVLVCVMLASLVVVMCVALVLAQGSQQGDGALRGASAWSTAMRARARVGSALDRCSIAGPGRNDTPKAVWCNRRCGVGVVWYLW